MAHEDVAIGNLRTAVRGLQELMQHLERGRRLGIDEATYSRQKVREAVRQLKTFQRLMEQSRHIDGCWRHVSWN